MNPGRSRKHLPRVLVTSVAALLSLAVAAEAASGTWTGNNGVLWADDLNWTGATYPNGLTETATFDDTGANSTPTITDTTISINTITFDALAPVHTITLNANGAGASLTIGGTTGTPGVVNNSLFTQNFAASGSGGNTATITLQNSATAGTNTSWTMGTNSELIFSGSSTASNASITIDSGGKLIFSGSSSGGTATITNNGGGIVDISQQGSGVSVGSIQGGGSFILGSSTLTTGSNGANTEVSGVISGTDGKLTKTGGGTLTLSGANTYTGVTTIEDGTIILTGDGSLSDSTKVNLTAGTAIFDIQGINAASETIGALQGVAGSQVIITGKNLTLTGDGSDFAGVISGAGGSLTKIGTGKQILSGANTYDGGTTLTGGTLYVGHNNALGTGSLTISDGTALGSSVNAIVLPNNISVQGNFFVGTDGSDFTLAGTVNLNGATRTITGFNQANQIHFAGPIQNGALTLATTFGGSPGSYVAFILDAGNVNTYTGLTTIDSGAFLVLQGTTANGAIQGDVLIQGNGVLDYLGGNGEQIHDAATVTVNSLGNNVGGTNFTGLDLFQAGGPGGGGTETIGTLNGNGLVGLSNGTLVVSAGNFTGNIIDGFHGGAFVGGNLTKNGTGTLTLSGANSYTGATTINDGKILMTGNGFLGDLTALNITTATGIFDMSGINASGDTIGSLASAVAGSSVIIGAKNLTVGGNNGTTVFAGVISGTGGSLTKTGAGTMTLTGVNTYTGPTAVNGGRLVADTTLNTTVIQSSSVLALNDGAFELRGAAAQNRVLVLDGLIINGGTNVIDVNNVGTTTTLDLRGTSGTRGIVRNGGGSVDFRATTGNFGVDAIVLTAQQNNSSGIIGTWATVNGSAFAMVDNTGKIVAFNNYTDINALGPVPVPNDPNAHVRINALGTAGPVPIAAPTTNIYTLTQNFTAPSIIDTSPGLLRFGVDGGIVIADGKADLTIGTAVDSGTITAGGSSSNVAGELTLNNQSASTLTINSVIANNGTGVVGVTKVGSGLTILAGTNTYTGATTIAEGELQLTGSLADTGAVNLTGATAIFNMSDITAPSNSETIGSLAGVAGSTVQLGSKGLTVGGNNMNTTFAGVIVGAGGTLTKVGTGSLSLSGNNTYTGGTTLNGGALFADHNNGVNAINNAFGTGTLTINSGTIGTHVLLSNELTNPNLPTAIETPGGNTSGTTITNAIEVLGNFSIATNVFVGNEGAQNFTLAGTMDLNGATRTITGVTSQGQIHLTGVISNGGLTLAVDPSISTYVAYLMDGAAANAYTGLTTVGNRAFLVLDNNQSNGAIQGNVVVESGGVLELYSGNQIADSATITVNSTGMNTLGTHFDGFEMAGQDETINTLLGNGTVGLGGGTLTLSQGNFSGSIRDGVNGTGGSLVKNGAGTLTLSGVNDYSGATVINNGTIALTGNGQLGDMTAVNVASATSVFDISGMTSTGDTIGSLTGVAGSSVILGAKNLTVGGNNGSTTFAGVISGTEGSLTKQGTGTMTLTGVNTYTGATTVNTGTLVADFGGNSSVLSSSSELVLGGGTFQLRGGTGAKTQIVSGLTLNAGNNVIDINNNGGTSTTLDMRGPNLLDPLGIERNGGTIDFRASGGGTFAVNSVVMTGQQNDASGMLGAWATVNGGAAFAMNDGTGKIVAYTGYNDIDIQARGPNPVPNNPNGNYRIVSDGTAGNVPISTQPITTINTLTQANTTSPLTAATIELAGGTLRFGKEGGIFIAGIGGVKSLVIGATPNDGFVTAGGADGETGDLILGNFATNGAKITINAAIKNNVEAEVSLTKTGGGLVELAGVNTYTGITSIQQGELQLIGGGSLSDSTAVIITNSQAQFSIANITAASETIGSLSGATGSLVALGDKKLIAGGNGNSTTFGGVMSGANGSFTKTGTGTMTLTGANTYTGLTVVEDGTLVLNTSGANAVAGGVRVEGGTLRLAQSSQIDDTKDVVVASGTFDLGANSELVNGVTLVTGSILGTTGTLFSSTTFDVRDGEISANLNGASDTVGLTKTTDGTVVLNGVNSYRGPTNVNAGTLVLNGVINGGLNGVNVNNGSEFIVGGNGFVVVGDGLTVVTATSGNTVNNAGILQGGNQSTGVVGANRNQIVNSGGIVGGAVGFKGVQLTGSQNFVSNSGFIVADRAIVMTNASGHNTAANYGSLTGNSGTAVDATGSTGSLTFVNVSRVNGNIRFGVGDDTMTIATRSVVNGIVDGGTGTNALRLVGGGTDTFKMDSGKVINFASLYKGGGGTWNLTGEGTYRNGTIVQEGNLMVQGNLVSDVVVELTGLLGGTGLITGNVVNFGIVSPGNSPGVMTIKGDYDQKSSGVLEIEVRSKDEHDLLKVGGTARLGGTLRIKNGGHAPTFKLGEKLTFLVADGGVEGEFKKFENPLPTATMIKLDVQYDSNAVSLVGAQGSYEEYALTHELTKNQRATAKVIDGAIAAGTDRKMIDFLNNRPLARLPEEFERIAPDELGAIYRVGVNLAGVQHQNIQRRTDDIRLSNRRVNASGFQAQGSAPVYSGQFAGGAAGPQGDGSKVVTRPPDRRWGAFLNGMGEWIRIGDTDNARGYDFSTGGVTAGVDYRVSDNFAVGVSAGYAGTSAQLPGRGDMEVNGGKLGAYATYFDGKFYVDAAVSGGYNSYETRRAGLQGSARGRTEGSEINAMLGAGYDWTIESLTLGALSSVEYTYLGFDGFEEDGSLAPLRYPDQSAQSLRTKLGFKVIYDWHLGKTLVRPELRAVWQHEFAARSFPIESGLASGSGGTFTVDDPAVGRDSLQLGLGGTVFLGERATTYLFYDGELYRKESDAHNISGGVRISF